MNKEHLKWTEDARKQILDCGIFTVLESYCKGPEAQSYTFKLIDTKDWAIVIPVIDTPEGKKFVMIWQWRQGSRCLSLEFPGGVFESGENGEQAALRELQEETGYKAGKITKLGVFSPNPAIMTNKAHFFLAEDLTDTRKLDLDENEFVEVVLVDEEEVINGMGKPPHTHALMGTALCMYLTKSGKREAGSDRCTKNNRSSNKTC